MKVKILLIIITVLIINCNSFIIRKGYDFTEKEEKILTETTKILGFDYGYDSRIEISYIFKIDNLNIDVNKNIKKFNSKLLLLNSEELSLFYKKIYELKEGISYLVLYSKRYKKWPAYNHLKNEILPALKDYERLLSNYFLNKYKNKYESIDKKIIKRDIILYYQTRHSIVDEY